jgi:selenium-binding protein 1
MKLLKVATTLMQSATLCICAMTATIFVNPMPATADETCQSPYMPKIEGQEEYMYVWTLGEEGLGDGFDKVVTIDLRPDSKTYGKVVHTESVGSRNEAHHGGFNDTRSHLWLGGLDTSKIFIFDVKTNPGKPKLVKTIDTFVKDSGGVVGPHGHYALPGRMMIAGLSNNKDHSGRTALVEYTNEGEYVTTHWMPITDDTYGARVEKVADGYGYDVRVLPRKNVMLTSSFTGWSNYMMDVGKVLADEEAMKRFGQTMVLWDLHTRKPKKVFNVPGSPLEIRFAWGEDHNYAFTASNLTSQLWLIYEDSEGEWQAEDVGDIGDPAKIPLPVAMSITSDDQLLYVTTFSDGMVRVYNVSDPHKPKQIYEKTIGKQLNMVSQSWDGKRVYFSSSVLSRWDKKGEDNEQFVKAYTWDGKELKKTFAVDFTAEKLGRPHLMRFGSSSLYQ